MGHDFPLFLPFSGSWSLFFFIFRRISTTPTFLSCLATSEDPWTHWNIDCDAYMNNWGLGTLRSFAGGSVQYSVSWPVGYRRLRDRWDGLPLGMAFLFLSIHPSISSIYLSILYCLLSIFDLGIFIISLYLNYKFFVEWRLSPDLSLTISYSSLCFRAFKLSLS